MNPDVPTTYGEGGRWLVRFLTSHVKRVDPRLEIAVEMGEAREGKSYGVRLALGSPADPAGGPPAMEFSYADVAEGRTRFAWCQALASQAREQAAGLIPHGAAADRRSS